jgi:hypothetical protein
MTVRKLPGLPRFSPEEWELSATIGECGYKWYVSCGVVLLTHPNEPEVAFTTFEEAVTWAMVNSDVDTIGQPDGEFRSLPDHPAHVNLVACGRDPIIYTFDANK